MRKKYLFLLLIPLLVAFAGCGKKKHLAGPPVPSSPSDLSATLISIINHSKTQIDLSWKDNSTIEKGFYVYRNHSGIAQLDPNTTSYSDESMGYEGIYRYKVTAYNDDGESASSNEAVVKIVEILDYHLEERYRVDQADWRTTIVGNVKNHSNQTLHVYVKGKYFNFNDVEVEVGSDTLCRVNAGETQPFETHPSYGEQIKRVEVWVDEYWVHER